jgi:hypothetical protein
MPATPSAKAPRKPKAPAGSVAELAAALGEAEAAAAEAQAKVAEIKAAIVKACS